MKLHLEKQTKKQTKQKTVTKSPVKENGAKKNKEQQPRLLMLKQANIKRMTDFKIE